mmetsp:Transcript_9153/g.12111  ORF Transcript_9153/g.12111 Transcript_9153/m.12111 type:complete len:93 (+) Transcript_9153:187-465(+)
MCVQIPKYSQSYSDNLLKVVLRSSYSYLISVKSKSKKLIRSSYINVGEVKLRQFDSSQVGIHKFLVRSSYTGENHFCQVEAEPHTIGQQSSR